MDREAFAREVLALKDVLYGISYTLLPNPEDQDDAVQECISRALQKREQLREARYLKTWLIRILINECYGVMRRRKRELPTDEIEAVAPPTADGEVFEALMTLEPKFRLPVVLHHIEGYGTREIARMLRVPEGTVKGRLVRARGKLKDMLEEGEGWR